MAWNPDFLMRRFLGEHLTAANDEPSLEDTQRSNENPNLQDLPEQALDHQPGTASGANPFWSSRMQEEYQLQQMRPEHLPPLESGDPWASLDTCGDSSEELMTSDLLMLTAQEMDRQTSVGRFTQADALQFLRESVAMGPTEPEFFNMAAGDEMSSGGYNPAGDMVTSLAGNAGITSSRYVPEPALHGTPPQGRGTQQSPEDFRGMLRTRRAGDPPSVKTPQGLRSEAPKSLPGYEGHGANSSQASGPGQGVSLAERRDATELSTSELKEKLREGHHDQSMILELVRRMEEVELRSKTSSSLHSALENVHSGPQPLQQGWGGSREGMRFRVCRLEVGRISFLLLDLCSRGCRSQLTDKVTRFSSGLPSTPLFAIGPGNQVRGQSNAVPGQGSAVPYQQQGFHALQAPLTASGVSQSGQQQGFHALQAPLTASGVSQSGQQQALQAPLTASGVSQSGQQQGFPALQGSHR